VLHHIKISHMSDLFGNNMITISRLSACRLDTRDRETRFFGHIGHPGITTLTYANEFCKIHFRSRNYIYTITFCKYILQTQLHFAIAFTFCISNCQSIRNRDPTQIHLRQSNRYTLHIAIAISFCITYHK
jgi:hypothetical protein